MVDRLGESPTFVSRSKTFSRAAAVFVIVLGLLILIGWLFNITRLKSIYGLITMKPNAALGLILIGVALWNVKASKQNSYRILGQLSAASAVLIGLLTLSEHVLGW